MTNYNLVVISDLGCVDVGVAESNFLPSYIFLVVDNDLTIPLMMHLIRLSDPCCQQTHEPLSRARGRVLVKREL